MLTTTQHAKLMNALNGAFDKIGHTNGHAMPETINNRDPIAWEFFVAQHLAKLAEGRKEKAQKACIVSGILFDHKEEPHPVGTHIIFNGDLVSYICTVKNPSSRVDNNKLKSELMKLGVSTDTIDKAFNAATTQSAAPHTFIGSLRTKE